MTCNVMCVFRGFVDNKIHAKQQSLIYVHWLFLVMRRDMMELSEITIILNHLVKRKRKMCSYQVADHHFTTSLLSQRKTPWHAKIMQIAEENVQIHLMRIMLLAKQEPLNISTLYMHSL